MRFNGFKALYFLHLVRAIPGEKGLIIGSKNPTSIVAFKGIPNKSSSLNNFTAELMPDSSIIWSLASDPICSHTECYLYFLQFFYLAKAFSDIAD